MLTARSSASTERARRVRIRRQVPSSKSGERFDVVRIQQQRDNELGVSFGLAAVLDVGAAQCLVRRRVVRGHAHSALQQTDRLGVVQMQLRQPGEGAIELALADEQHQPIRHVDESKIVIILPRLRACR